MSRGKILLSAIHHWDSPLQVSSHAIARYLSSLGFEVAYVSAPLTPLHFFRGNSSEAAIRVASNRRGGDRDTTGLVWHYVPYAWLAPTTLPFLSAGALIKNWHLLAKPNLQKVLAAAGFGAPDALILCSPFQPFWQKLFPAVPSAYRLSDNTGGFRGATRGVIVTEKNIIQSVDVVFPASTGLKIYAERSGAKRAALVRNGVDHRRFGEVPGLGLFKGNAFNISRPVAVYVGAIDYWFDHALVAKLAQARPNLNVVLIGPVMGPLPDYSRLDNVHFIGAVGSNQVAAYLSSADVGLIPFNVSAYPRLLHDVNPLKLYEYMAAGLPVVAARWSELERLNSPAHLYDDQSAFIRAIDQILAKKKSTELEQDFALQHAWQNTLSPVGQWVEEVVQDRSGVAIT